MKIAQIAPLWERVPSPVYGSTERVVGLLTDELVRRGHDVTLFATGDSKTLARLEPGSTQALRLLGTTHQDYAIYDQMQLSKVFQRANEFDLIHSHVDYSALPYAAMTKTPVVHTIHGRFTAIAEKMFAQHRHQNYISISNSQRRPELGLNYRATVYNAIAVDSFDFYSHPENPPYLAFLGQMSPDNGPQVAIEIAQRSGWHLKMAGQVDSVDREFFEQEVAPLIDGEQIEFIGQANHEQKNKLMGGATATLFPIQWREPFALVMAESMACGTPLIAINIGSALEVIADGKTGFLCQNVQACVEALSRISSIDRQACRSHVAENFNVKRMVDSYEEVYNQILVDHVVWNGHLKTPVLLAS